MPKPVVKEGKVISLRGKFYVQLGRSRKEIPAAFADPAALKKLAGQTTSVTLLGKSIVAVGRRPGPIIICYIPVPDIFKLIQPDLQRFLQKKYMDAGILAG
jgi:hypothetical protein